MQSDPPPGYPAHRGHYFTRTLHSKAEGVTAPTANALPSHFTIAVSGGGKGIGAAIAMAYAQAGASGVILASRSATDLEATTSNLKSGRPSLAVVTQVCDVTQEGDIISLVAKTRESFGRLDVLVNCAGTTPTLLPDGDNSSYKRGPFGLLEGGTVDFLRVMDVNLGGVYLSTRHFLPLLLSSASGARTVVTIASEAAHSWQSHLSPICYTLSKLATIRLMETVAEAHKHEGILTHAVHPGAIVTDTTAGLPPAWIKSE